MLSQGATALLDTCRSKHILMIREFFWHNIGLLIFCVLCMFCGNICNYFKLYYVCSLDVEHLLNVLKSIQIL